MPPKTKPPSHRGDKPGKKGDVSDRSKKKSVKKKPVEKALDSVAETAEEETLWALAEVTAPLQEIINGLRGQISETEAKRGDVEAEAAKEEVAAPVDHSKDEEKMKRRTGALRVWKNFAAQRLSEMASSLEAALQQDSKLRDLFEKIDLDLGGSIDEEELAGALKAAGKNVTASTVTEMFKAADYDNGGDIDFSEFADVIKGVKASKAAFILERGVRRHQEAKAKKVLLTKPEFETKLGAALLKQGSPKEMIALWDRSKKRGMITQIEFRQGVRFRFVLNFENRDCDEWFERFDKSGDGNLDLPELKDMFRAVADKSKRAKAEAEELKEKAEALAVKAEALEAEVAACVAAFTANDEAAAKLVEHRALLHLDAKVGERLRGKIKSADNPKAVLSFEDCVSQWDISRKIEGHMDKEEVAGHPRAISHAAMSAAPCPQRRVPCVISQCDLPM